MAGRGQPKISLFPFMSILACTIGALTLLLVAMSLSAVGRTDAATRAYVETKEMNESERETLDEENRRLEIAERLWSEVDAALVARGLASGLSQSSIDLEMERADRRAAVSLALREVEDQEQDLERDRDTIETTIDVLESRRETLPILIDPTGLSRHLEPYFIECDKGGATAYRAKDDFRYFVAKEDLSNSGVFGRYLRRVQVVPGALLILLVRPDGISTSIRTANIVRAAGLRVALLPLPGRGALDWSLLRRAEGGKS